jgi:hypothetical protein
MTKQSQIFFCWNHSYSIKFGHFYLQRDFDFYGQVFKSFVGFKKITVVSDLAPEISENFIIASEKMENQVLKKDSKVAHWEETKLCSWALSTVNSLGLKKPTPIQIACIPQILKGIFKSTLKNSEITILGKDVVGGSPTGSGKTAAFALPILHKLSENPFGVFALVLTPTR